MKALQLNDRNQELVTKIPKKYRSSILNTIIAKSVENGSFLKELSLFVGESELEDISSQLNITVEKKKIERKKVYKPKITNKQKVSDSEKLFIGFDD